MSGTKRYPTAWGGKGNGVSKSWYLDSTAFLICTSSCRLETVTSSCLPIWRVSWFATGKDLKHRSVSSTGSCWTLPSTRICRFSSEEYSNAATNGFSAISFTFLLPDVVKLKIFSPFSSRPNKTTMRLEGFPSLALVERHMRVGPWVNFPNSCSHAWNWGRGSVWETSWSSVSGGWSIADFWDMADSDSVSLELSGFTKFTRSDAHYVMAMT